MLYREICSFLMKETISLPMLASSKTDSLVIDETPLFDGAVSVQKRAEGMPEAVGVPPEKQRNMVFGGTYVTAGQRTGNRSEDGQKSRAP